MAGRVWEHEQQFRELLQRAARHASKEILDQIANMAVDCDAKVRAWLAAAAPPPSSSWCPVLLTQLRHIGESVSTCAL